MYRLQCFVCGGPIEEGAEVVRSSFGPRHADSDDCAEFMQDFEEEARMLHRGCGGEVTERHDEEPYMYCAQDDCDCGGECDRATPVPVLRCGKCGREVVGDSMLVLRENATHRRGTIEDRARDSRKPQR